MPLLNTSQKICVARILYKITSLARRILGLTDKAFAKRGGINWELDLQEGIDLSIFLLGGFEPRTLKLYKSLVHPGFVAFDIGANIGSHTLPLANLVGDTGKVYAVEPTGYAFAKLKRNIELNASLESRIESINAMLVSDSKCSDVSDVYSSWPLTNQDGLHKQHYGRLMSVQGARAISLDDLVSEKGVSQIDFMKIDVDGNEIDVLAGGSGTIEKFRPTILMEFAPYLFKDKMEGLEKVVKRFFDLNYMVREASTNQLLPNDFSVLCSYVPEGGSMNVVFVPI